MHRSPSTAKIYLLEKGDEIIIEAKNDDDGWPEKIEKGGLRKRMGLKKDEPLEDQTTPEKVAEFFKDADKDGRGKVMFAVNSNQDVPFWKKVAELIEPEEG